MKKKIALLFSVISLCLIMLLTACSNYTSSLVFYEIHEDSPYDLDTIGEVAVVEDKDYDLTQLIIPQTYKGKPVTVIGIGAFVEHNQLTEVEIPEGIKYIYESAFSECARLTKITLPDTLLVLSYGVFENDCELKSITIGKNVKVIGFNAFYGCIKLKNVYYSGTQENWNKIKIGKGNECLLNADIHFSE